MNIKKGIEIKPPPPHIAPKKLDPTPTKNISKIVNKISMLFNKNIFFKYSLINHGNVYKNRRNSLLMKRATYMGTYNSTMVGGNVPIPNRILNQIRLREGTIPNFFYGFHLKEGAFPYIYLLHPEDLQEQEDQIAAISSEDISDTIHRIEVREYERLVIPIELREFAELYKRVNFIGYLDHFEIWDRKNAVKQERASDIFMKKHPRAVERLYDIAGL